MTTAAATKPGLFAWWREGDDAAHKAFWAASIGWALDAFDVMLFSLLLPAVIQDLGLTRPEAGALGSLTLLVAAGGGVLFGIIADRYGRTKALMGSVLIYSTATALCGLSNNIWQFAACRFLLGFGLGGEWASGAALVSETWPAKHRGKALGMMQSAWAVGYGGAALVTAIVLPRFGWRAVFFVGILPALLTIWVRRNVQEPKLWRERHDAARTDSAGAGSRTKKPSAVWGALFGGGMARVTIAVTLMNACTLFGWWGMNTWVPSYLQSAPDKGGIGLSAQTMSMFVLLMQVGMFFGYVTFGYFGDAIGRKRAYVVYLLAASVLLPLYGFMSVPMFLLAVGPFVAFFGTGFFSGFGAVTAELYPTPVRATAQGFCYNTGRIASAAAPWTVGTVAATDGFGKAFIIVGAAYLLAAMMWRFIPETQGRELA